MSVVWICGGVTPFKKNIENPNGGVINDVCKFTAIKIANHTGLICKDSTIGKSIGKMIYEIST